MLGIAYAIGGAGGGGGKGGLGALFPIMIMFVIFYFLLIRPQQKRSQNTRMMQENLRKGDRVLFCGGMYGKILNIKGSVVSIEIAEKIKVDVQRNAIAGQVKEE